MQFCRPEYWSGYLFPSPGDLPNPGIELGSPALQPDSLPTELSGKPSESQTPFKTQPDDPGRLPDVSCWKCFFSLNDFSGDLLPLKHQLQLLALKWPVLSQAPLWAWLTCSWTHSASEFIYCFFMDLLSSVGSYPWWESGHWGALLPWIS